MQSQNLNKPTNGKAEPVNIGSLDESTISDYLNIEKSIAKITGNFKALFNYKRQIIDQRSQPIDPVNAVEKLRGVQSITDARLNQNRSRNSTATNMMRVR